MAVTTDRVNGRGIQITASTAENSTEHLTRWTSITVEAERREDDATASSSDDDQFDIGPLKTMINVEGFVGGSETAADLPQPGDELKTILVKSVLTGNASLIRSLAGKKVVVTKVNYKQDSKPGTYSFTARTGYAGGAVSGGGGGGA